MSCNRKSSLLVEVLRSFVLALSHTVHPSSVNLLFSVFHYISGAITGEPLVGVEQPDPHLNHQINLGLNGLKVSMHKLLPIDSSQSCSGLVINAVGCQSVVTESEVTT